MNSLPPIPPTSSPTDLPTPIQETPLSSQSEMNSSTTIPSSFSPDLASLSFRTQDITLSLEAMSQIPEMRHARIQHLQEAIDSNSYHISAENLADALLRTLPAPPH